jgi:uncharacterized protein YndB with AHSA1/START domain
LLRQLREQLPTQARGLVATAAYMSASIRVFSAGLSNKECIFNQRSESIDLFNSTTELPMENPAVQTTPISRRSLALGLAVLPVGLVIGAETSAAPKAKKSPAAADGLSHTSEAIRQQITLDASPQRVYEALTSTKAFDMITRLSDAAVLLDAAGAKPTSISTEVGGSFTLFGGYVTGRHLEMLPNERLIQAWSAGSWKPGDYSIAAFYLTADSGKTKLRFEHRGFPDGDGVPLAQGWHSHYWVPLAKYLAQG